MREITDAISKIIGDWLAPEEGTVNFRALQILIDETGDSRPHLLVSLWELVSRLNPPDETILSFVDAAHRLRTGELVALTWKHWQSSNSASVSGSARMYRHFARAGASGQQAAIVREIWTHFKNTTLLDGYTCETVAAAAAKLNDPDLFREIWKSTLATVDRVTNRALSGMAKPAGFLCEREILGTIWQHFSGRCGPFHPADLKCFAEAAGATRDSALLTSVWAIAQTSLEARDVLSYAEAAAAVESAELLRDVWSRAKTLVHVISFGEKELGRLAVLAAGLRDACLFTEIWDKCKESFENLSSRAWGSFAHAAKGLPHNHAECVAWKVLQDCARASWPLDRIGFSVMAGILTEKPEPSLFESLWSAFQTTTQELDSQALTSMLDAAGAAGHADAIQTMWTTRDRVESIDTTCLGSFIKAAAIIQNLPLCREVWSGAKLALSSFKSGDWGSFASAAAHVGGRDLLVEIWDAATNYPGALGRDAWGSFATAAASCGNPELLRRVWLASEPARGGFDSQAWGSFATAAAKCGDIMVGNELLVQIWGSMHELQTQFPGDALGSFANAAARCGNAELLWRVWEASEPTRHTLDSRAWGAFTAAAATISDSPLLRAVWEAAMTILDDEAAAWAAFELPARALGDDEIADGAAAHNRNTIDVISQIRTASRKRLAFLVKDPKWSRDFLEKNVCRYFATTCIRLHAADSLQYILTHCHDMGIDFEQVEWAQLARVAGHLHSQSCMRELWQGCLDAQVQFEDWSWSTMALSALDACDNESLTEMMEFIGERVDAEQYCPNELVLGNFARVAGELGNASVVAKAWDIHQLLGHRPTVIGQTIFARAAGLTQNATVLEEAWRACEEAEKTIDVVALSTFARAAGLTGDLDLLRRVWEKRHTLQSSEVDSTFWGTVAGAAGDCESCELLHDVWTEFKQRHEQLDPQGWTEFVTAAVACNDSTLVADVWRELTDQKTALDNITIVKFGTAFGAMGASDLLDALLREIEQQHVACDVPSWIALVNAGARLDLRCFLPRIFRIREQRLSTRQRQHRNEVDARLARLVSGVPELQYIDDTINGLRIDYSALLPLVTAEVDPDESSAAAGCVMKWLISSSLFATPGEFLSRIRRLTADVGGLNEQARNRVWLLLLYSAATTAISAVRRLGLRQLLSQFGYLETLEVGELIRAIRDESRVFAQIKQFLKNVTSDAPLPQVLQCATALDTSLQDALVRMCAAQGKSLGFDDAAVRVAADQATQAWADVIASHPTCQETLLLHTIAETVKETWSRQQTWLAQRTHRFKNEFHVGFVIPLQEHHLQQGQRERLAVRARHEILQLDRPVVGYTGMTAVPIAIVPLLNRYLVRNRRNLPSATVRFPKRVVMIAGWEGTAENTLIPLLLELKSNLGQAHSSLSLQEREFHLSLETPTEGPDLGMAILTVKNSYRPGSSSSSRSTGHGHTDIQMLAGELEFDGRRGYAERHQIDRQGALPLWVWKVAFPLWTQPKS